MDTLLFTSIPANSIILVPEERREDYLYKALSLPTKSQDILFSSDTGAFIRGLAKSYDIDPSLAPNISLTIFFIAIGKKNLTELPTIFSTELGLAPDQAQKMAAEIEKDIFGPIKGELDEYLQPQKGKSAGTTTLTSPNPSFVRRGNGATQPNNLLDLKEIAAAKRQEQLTAKPLQTQLPKRQVPPRIAPPLSPRSPSAFAKATADKHPNPLPEQERGTTPKFPLPPRAQAPSPLTPPKPSVSPLDFSKY